MPFPIGDLAPCLAAERVGGERGVVAERLIVLRKHGGPHRIHICRRNDALAMCRLVPLRDHSCEQTLVESHVIETDRERTHLLTRTTERRCHRRRVDTSTEEGADRHVGHSHLGGGGGECIADGAGPVADRFIRRETEIPIELRRTDSRGAVDGQVHAQPVPGGEFVHTGPDGARVEDESEGQEIGHGDRVDGPREAGPGGERLEFGGEDQCAIELCVVERFLSDPITRTDERALLLVPEREGEHPRQTCEALGTPTTPALDQHLGVRVRARDRALGLQLSSKRAIVVDLAVERDPIASVTRRHRLIGARRRVDDREPPVTERYPSVASAPQSGRIGASKRQPVTHRLDHVSRGRNRRQNPHYATHQRWRMGEELGCDR